MTVNLRNIAIIAHVDHGKTTLVDKLLRQSGTLDARTEFPDRVMDSHALERERGITILAKNTAIRWKDARAACNWRINLVDTPGHADFGGEVERVLSMVDSVLLLVDAVEGPMPQTRFVTQKAFAKGLCPIVVVNKIDRPGARPDWVIDQVFELFDRLGASEGQLDFPIVYASALEGTATLDLNQPKADLTALFETIVDKTPPPPVDPQGPFQMQLSALDYSSYVGAIGIGRIHRGTVKTGSPIVVINREGKSRPARILQLLGYLGLERHEITEAVAGDIVAVTGIERPGISDTLCTPETPEPLPPLSVDEPTVSVQFRVNDSPLAGRDGKYVTSRQLRERLDRELIHNVALRVSETEDPNRLQVSGRGELHLSVLIETMRREGFELGVSRPEVILKEKDGVLQEPYERLTVDIEEAHQGAIMEKLGARRGELLDSSLATQGRIRLDYRIPTRALIGFQTEFLTATSGLGLMHHVFERYGPTKKGAIAPRQNGVLIANQAGKASAFALFNLQARGKLFIDPQMEVYEGMIVGVHARDNDLVVNVIKGKQLTNIRAAGSDENIILTPPLKFGLEETLGLIDDDELVEVTPRHIRLRKKFLKEHERKRASRQA